ncbi:MAG: DMT family transporter [Bacteroidales bacterium]|nr:DMT family transporter [Bacteroidales bacterium]
MYTGEILSFATVVAWTTCAMFGEVASKRMGTLPFNVARMTLSLIFLAGLLWFLTGKPIPVDANLETWLWLLLSGFVGYVLGDFCLYNSYNLIGARYGQLLMTLAPPSASLFGWVLLGERMSFLAFLGMMISISGIIIAIHHKKSDSQTSEKKLSSKGILYGIGAGVGQGVGLVLSSKGLHCYFEAVEGSGLSVNIMSFEGTFIRAVAGLIGFAVWTSFRYRLPRFYVSVSRSGVLVHTIIATITGPFIGVGLSLMATQYTSAGIAQTIMSLTPVLILLPTYFFFHQKITVREVIGAVVAVGGVTLFFV